MHKYKTISGHYDTAYNLAITTVSFFPAMWMRRGFSKMITV